MAERIHCNFVHCRFNHHQLGISNREPYKIIVRFLLGFVRFCEVL